MAICKNTEAEARAKQILGAKWANYLRLGIRAYSRVVSYTPLQPVRLLGLKAAGAALGRDIVLAPGVEVLSPWRLSIGSHTNIGRHAYLDARGDLRIGDNVNISAEAAIWTSEHDVQSPTFAMTRGAILIEDRVWVSFRSIILPGVRLGEGCIVAAGAVVTASVPPFSVAAGVPAKIVGLRNRNLTYELGNPKSARHRGRLTTYDPS
jgi:acetyltransferase-like isoleucine patch superfamily enzyme